MRRRPSFRKVSMTGASSRRPSIGNWARAWRWPRGGQKRSAWRLAGEVGGVDGGVAPAAAELPWDGAVLGALDDQVAVADREVSAVHVPVVGNAQRAGPHPRQGVWGDLHGLEEERGRAAGRQLL